LYVGRMDERFVDGLDETVPMKKVVEVEVEVESESVESDFESTREMR
jgi:hypothetical protein